MDFTPGAVGKVVKKCRQEKKLTQEVLSGLAGIGRVHLTMIENGDREPTFENIWRLAQALRMEPHELVGKVEEEVEKYDNQSLK